MQYFPVLLLFCLVIAFTNTSHAADMTGDTHTTLYAGFNIGAFQPDKNPNKIILDDNFYLDGNIGIFLNPYFAIQIDLLDYERDGYRLPAGVNIPGTSTNQFSLSTRGVSIDAIANYPLHWFRPYVGAGLGYYVTELTIDNNTLCLGPASFCSTSSHNSIGYQAVAGIDLDINKYFSLGFAWRKIYLSQDYGIYTNDNVDVGGEAITIGMKFKTEF